MSTAHQVGQSAGIQHIELNGVNLGSRPPVLQLEYGMIVPIIPENVLPVARFRSPWVRPDIDAQNVTVLKVLSASFYVAAIETKPSLRSGSESQPIPHYTDEIWDLWEIAEECSYVGESAIEYFDQEFRREVEGRIDREEMSSWTARLPRLRVFSDHVGLGAQFDCGDPCYFASGEQMAHRLLSLMAEDFPHRKHHAKEAMRLLEADGNCPWKWAQNQCSITNRRMAPLCIGYELKCSKADSLIIWKKTTS